MPSWSVWLPALLFVVRAVIDALDPSTDDQDAPDPAKSRLPKSYANLPAGYKNRPQAAAQAATVLFNAAHESRQKAFRGLVTLGDVLGQSEGAALADLLVGAIRISPALARRLVGVVEESAKAKDLFPRQEE